jgi:hypothetical protein
VTLTICPAVSSASRSSELLYRPRTANSATMTGGSSQIASAPLFSMPCGAP